MSPPDPSAWDPLKGSCLFSLLENLSIMPCKNEAKLLNMKNVSKAHPPLPWLVVTINPGLILLLPCVSVSPLHSLFLIRSLPSLPPKGRFY